jgi:hypothetical protein
MTWKPILISGFLLAFFSIAPAIAQERRNNHPPLQSYAGAWKGSCADGKEFIEVTLESTASGLTGTISMGNFKGDNGQCATVVSPPSPEHAMRVVDVKLQGAVLSFKGNRGPSFEMTLTDGGAAELKFLGTPVEDRPWVLKRQ